ANARIEAVIAALARLEPNLSRVRGIGFCVSVLHAQVMADRFNARGIASAVLVGETDPATRADLLDDLRSGRLTFLFTRDVLSEDSMCLTSIPSFFSDRQKV